MNLAWIVLIVLLGIIVVAVLMRKRIRGRETPQALRTGQPLPAFDAVDEDGNTVSSASLRGAPAVLLFVRGSWCPFCSKQVKDLTRVYKEITDAGARLILVTSRPLDTTRRVADLFGVDFEFWLDEGLEVVRELGLLIEAGIPEKSRQEFGSDTIWPVSLVVDGEGVIRLTEMSRFIADRPKPEKFLAALKKL